ncbi:hypothetical protein ACFX2J_038338 [Malus domestica]
MKKNFSVKKWPLELALEEVEMETIPFWVQVRGVPLSLISTANIKRLAREAREFVELEDLAKSHSISELGDCNEFGAAWRGSYSDYCTWEVSDPKGREKKKWHRVPRSKMPPDQVQWIVPHGSNVPM